VKLDPEEESAIFRIKSEVFRKNGQSYVHQLPLLSKYASVFASFLKEQEYSLCLDSFHQFLFGSLPVAEKKGLWVVKMQCKKEQVLFPKINQTEEADIENKLEETLKLSISREFKVLQSVGDLRVFFQDDR
jgi:hypothetical protein